MKTKNLVISLITGVIIGFMAEGNAQSPSSGGLITGRPSAEKPKVPDFSPDEDETEQKSQDLDLIQPSPKVTKPDVLQNYKLLVKTFQFTNNSVFTDDELQKVTAPYHNRAISLAELEELRLRLTKLYIDKGYISSGVILPKQTFKDNIVQFNVIEGKLSEIRITGNEHLAEGYIRSRLYQYIETPMSSKELQDSFQMMLANPLIDSMEGKLLPGVKQGDAILDLNVIRATPYQLSFSVDNYRPPSIGGEQGQIYGWLRNLTGYGDVIDFGVTLSESAFNEGRLSIAGGLSIPITPYDTLFGFRFDNNETSIVEEPLDEIDIENDYFGLQFSLHQPIYKTLQQSAVVGVKLDIRENKSTLLGRPFSFSLGEEDGFSKVSVLRFTQDFVDRRINQVFSFRSTFSVGLNAFDATWHDDGRPDGDFFSWLGQVNYARKILDNGAQIRFQGSAQLTNDVLLSLEKYAVGGRYSVRGYRINELVRDQGYAMSVEFDYPLFGSKDASRFFGKLSFVPFVDYGVAFNYKNDIEDQLYSVGAGLVWRPFPNVFTEFFYAYALAEVPKKLQDNIQDNGIHFRVSADLF